MLSRGSWEHQGGFRVSWRRRMMALDGAGGYRRTPGRAGAPGGDKVPGIAARHHIDPAARSGQTGAQASPGLQLEDGGFRTVLQARGREAACFSAHVPPPAPSRAQALVLRCADCAGGDDELPPPSPSPCVSGFSHQRTLLALAVPERVGDGAQGWSPQDIAHVCSSP